MGVTLDGDAGRVLVDGRQVGNVYRWHLEGIDGAWSATAGKYRLAEVVGDVEFVFGLGPLRIEASGRFESAVVADGVVHRDSVCLRGERIWLRTSESNSQTATGLKSAHR